MMLGNLYDLFTVGMDPSMATFMLMVGAPLLLGMLVTMGRWKLVLKAYGLWVGLLFGAFFFMTGGDINQTLFGFMVFFMFFTIVGVPALALVMRLWGWVRAKV